MAFLKIIRTPNLLIIAIFLYLLRLGMYMPSLKDFAITPVLDNSHFLLFVLTTLLITAGGYIINDIYDVEIDAHNNPDKQIVGAKWGLKKTWAIYTFISGLGLASSIYLGLHIHHPLWIFIFPSACITLWLYAAYWKRKPIIGNVVVSLFSAGVVWILFLSEISSLKKLPIPKYDFILYVTAIYFVFAFITSLFREIIKDMEDKEGDAQFGAQTIAILWSTKSIHRFCNSILLLNSGLILFVCYKLYLKEITPYFFYYAGLLLGLNILLMWQTYTATESIHYKRISQLTKVFMLLGILGLILINWIFIKHSHL